MGNIEQIIIKVVACEGGDLAIIGETETEIGWSNEVISSPWGEDLQKVIKSVWDQSHIVKQFSSVSEGDDWFGGHKVRRDWESQWLHFRNRTQSWITKKQLEQTNQMIMKDGDK